jgi:hypothetical protein
MQYYHFGIMYRRTVYNLQEKSNINLSVGIGAFVYVWMQKLELWRLFTFSVCILLSKRCLSRAYHNKQFVGCDVFSELNNGTCRKFNTISTTITKGSNLLKNYIDTNHSHNNNKY